MKLRYRILALLLTGLVCLSMMGATLGGGSSAAVGIAAAEELAEAPAEETVEETIEEEAAETIPEETIELPVETPEEEVIAAQAEEPVQEAARDGDSANLTWAIDNGCLTIQGSGAVAFDSANAPGDDQLSSVTNIVIGEGFASIGADVFSACSSLKKLTLPATMVSIDASAFSADMTIAAAGQSGGEGGPPAGEGGPGGPGGDMGGDKGGEQSGQSSAVTVYYRGSESAWAGVTWPDSTGAARMPTYYNASGADIMSLVVGAGHPILEFEEGTGTMTQVAGEGGSSRYLSFDLVSALRENKDPKSLTITHADGFVCVYDFSDGLTYLGQSIVANSDQSATNIWTEGTHYFQYAIGEATSGDVEVKVTANTVEKLVLVKGTGYEYVNGLDNANDRGTYDASFALNGAVIRVEFNNGDAPLELTLEGMSSDGGKGLTIGGYSISYTDGQPWTVDGDNKITLTYRGKTLEIPVAVIENPVESIEVLPEKSSYHEYMEFAEGEWRTSPGPDGVSMFYYDATPLIEGLVLQVNYKDGSSVEWDVSKSGTTLNGRALEPKKGEGYDTNWVPNVDKDGNRDSSINNKLTLVYMGQETTIEYVTVKECLVAGIEITEVDYSYLEGYEIDPIWKRMTGENKYMLAPLLNSLTLKITYKTTNDQGESETKTWDVSKDGLVIEGMTLTISVDTTGMAKSQDFAVLEAGGNPFYVYLGNMSDEDTVQVLTESPVKSIEVTGLDDCSIWKGVHNYLPWGASIKVTFTDGEEKNFCIDGSLDYYASDTVSGYLLSDGHFLTMDMPSKTCGTHTGTISYLDKSAEFAYTVKGSDGGSPDGMDLGIDAIVAENIAEDGIGTTFNIFYDNGGSYSFTLKAADIVEERFTQTGMSSTMVGATVYRHLMEVDGQLADILLYAYYDDGGDLSALWIDAHNTWQEHYHSAEGHELLLLYRKGLTASAAASGSSSSGSIDGSYVAPAGGVDLNDDTVSTGSDSIGIDVTSGDGVISTSIRMSAPAADSLADSGKDISIATDVAELSFDNTTVSEIAAGVESRVDIDVSLSEEGSSAVLDVSLSVLSESGQELHLLGETETDRNILMRLPVPDCLADCETIYVHYRAADGGLTLMPAAVEEVDGVAWITIETNHFSEYVLSGDTEDAAKIRVVLDYGDGNTKVVSLAAGERPETPEGDGFLGWYDAEGKKVEEITEPITLYAKWQSQGGQPSPSPAPGAQVVKTGDDTQLWPWILLMSMTAAAMVALWRKKKA